MPVIMLAKTLAARLKRQAITVQFEADDTSTCDQSFPSQRTAIFSS